MLPITEVAINSVIYPSLISVTTNSQSATLIEPGESLFVSWYLSGQQNITNIIKLQGTAVTISLLFSNNNWVNNIQATLALVGGKPPRMTLSGAPLGRIILGEWNNNTAISPYGETMTVQLVLQTPLQIFAPKIVATFY